MLETLTCSAGHQWTRESTRGRKPVSCPEHRGDSTPTRAKSSLAEPEIDLEVLAILSDPSPRNPELVSKLRYVDDQLSRPERSDDKAFLLNVKRDLMRELRRK